MESDPVALAPTVKPLGSAGAMSMEKIFTKIKYPKWYCLSHLLTPGCRISNPNVSSRLTNWLFTGVLCILNCCSNT